jgi:hypothetical protein
MGRWVRAFRSGRHVSGGTRGWLGTVGQSRRARRDAGSGTKRGCPVPSQTRGPKRTLRGLPPFPLQMPARCTGARPRVRAETHADMPRAIACRRGGGSLGHGPTCAPPARGPTAGHRTVNAWGG